MYGYVRIHAPELKVREQEYYRAVYCGLCRSLGKCTGQCSRMTLSYDFTFFALMRMAIEGFTPDFKTHRCPVHPLHKKPMAEPCDILTLSAYASGVMGYHKIADDRMDEKGSKRFKASLVAPAVASYRRRAMKKGYADLDARVATCMTELSDLEKARPASVDQPAELFGALMADILAYGLDGDQKKLALTVGRHVGRWIYIVDAADDLEEDVKRGRYNPLIFLWGDAAMTDDRRETLRLALQGELIGIEKAMDLIPVTDEQADLRGVLRNILYEGMPAMAKKILYDEKQMKGQK